MDKKVNVKITANTSKFKKAVSDATKSLNNMKKAGDKLGKAKIDKNLNKQFNNITKSSKKVDKQLKQNTKSLNNINKTKLSNITKQFTNMDKTVKNNQKTLSSLQKVLNSLKAKSIESINKALTTMSKGASTVSKGFSNVKNVLSSISSKTIEALNKSITTLNNKCPTVAKGFNTIKSSISNISSKAFNTLSSALSNVKSKASTVGQGFSNLKSKISDASKASFQKLVDSITKVNTEGTKSGNVFTNIGNKIKSLTSGALGGLSSKIGLVVSSTGKMGSTFATTAAQVALVTTATKSLTTTNNNAAKSNKQIETSAKGFVKANAELLGSTKLSVESIKAYETRVKQLDEAIKRNRQQQQALKEVMDITGTATQHQVKQLEQLEQEERNLTKEKEKLNKTIEKEQKNVENNKKAFEQATKSTKDAAKAEDTLKNSTEKANGSTRKLVSGTQTLRSKTGDLRKELGMAANAAKKMGNAEDEAGKKAKSFSEKVEDLSKSLDNTFEKLGEGDFSGAFNGLKSAGKAVFALMPEWAKAATVAAIALKKLYDLGKQRFFEGLSNIKNKLQPVIDVVRNLGSQLKTTFETVTDFRLNISGLAQAGINFESQMNKVANISGANANQLEKLSDKAKLLGSTTRFQAYQIGQAYEYMGMAGWSAAEMLDGVNAVINLSILSGSDLATASDIVTDDLTAMGLQANQTADFVDKLAATITRSNTTVELYGESMKQCGAQAGSLGVSVTDLNTSIGLMANAGIKGSKAGMSMKNMLANMAAPTDAMEAALKKLGLTADKTGSYLKTTAEGNVDLEATCKSLMKAMKGMSKTQQMALITTIAGKNAAPGIIALLSQGEKAWDELSDQIENSTSKVQYWNENMSVMGKKGDEAREIIEKFKDVFSKVEEEATAMGMSTEDLSLAIQALGSDGEVTAENMKHLMKVLESMNDTSDETQKKWRELSKGIKDSNSKVVKAVKTGFDYDKTVADIRADTSGLTQAQKEQVISQLKTNMTYGQANKILKKYSLTASRVTLSSMTYADKLEYLRETMKGLSKEERATALENLGLKDSIEEVNEICDMSDKEWKQYKKNQETIKSLSEQMAKAMDEDTKGALLGLASAIEGKAIQVFEKLKGSIKAASKALSEFFGAWKETNLTTALLGGYKDDDGNVDIGLVKKVQNAAKKIPEVIKNAITSAKNFVTGGGLQGILDMGTAIITGICQGIINNKEDLTTAISEGIRYICDWIHDNKDQVKEAGLTILQAIGDGIKENGDEIDTACTDIYEIINAWLAANEHNIYALGNNVGVPFINGVIDGIKQDIQGRLSGLWDSTIENIKNLPSNLAKKFNLEDFLKSLSSNAKVGSQNVGMQIANGIMEGLGIPNFSEAIDGVVKKIIDWFKEKFGIHSPSKVMADEVGQHVILGVAQGILDHIGDFFSKVGELKDKIVNFFKDLFGFGKDKENPINNLDASKAKELDKVLQSLNKTAQTCQKNLSTAFNGLNNTLRTNFVSCANIARNQFTNISNIVKNQSTNARNAATSQFISLKKVISTQLSEARQIVTSKMLSISKVVNTQSSNARNNATRQFISLRKVIQTQMSQAYSSVSSYMSKIASATNRTLHTKVSVTRSVKTVDAGGASALATAFKSLNSMALSGSGLTYAAAGGYSGVGSNGGYNNSNNNNAMYFELPTYLDGKLVAKTTAKYMNNELTILDKKNSRKRGNI